MSRGRARRDFISVPVTDLERSTRFYGTTLGLPSRSAEARAGPSSSSARTSALYLIDPTRHRLSSSRPRTRRTSRCACPTSRRRARELEAQGVEFEGDILDTGVCHMAFFRDPDGNALMLHRRYAPHG